MRYIIPLLALIASPLHAEGVSDLSPAEQREAREELRIARERYLAEEAEKDRLMWARVRQAKPSIVVAEGVIGDNKLDRETMEAVQREHDARRAAPTADDYDPFPNFKPSPNVKIQSIRPRKPTAIVKADDAESTDRPNGSLPRKVPAAKAVPRRRITFEFSIYLD